MIPCNCLVQAGQIPPDTEAALRASLTRFSERAFSEPAEINWVTVPEQSGFSAGEPSTSSVVSLRAPEPLEQSKRVALLTELCDLWIAETGCSSHEFVGVINDPVKP